MVRKVTVYDVAQRAGVSSATVSFAFTRPEKIKPETVQTVMAAADELGYVPSASARGLALGRTGAIGIYSYDYAHSLSTSFFCVYTLSNSSTKSSEAFPHFQATALCHPHINQRLLHPSRIQSST